MLDGARLFIPLVREVSDMEFRILGLELLMLGLELLKVVSVPGLECIMFNLLECGLVFESLVLAFEAPDFQGKLADHLIAVLERGSEVVLLLLEFVLSSLVLILELSLPGLEVVEACLPIFRQNLSRPIRVIRSNVDVLFLGLDCNVGRAVWDVLQHVREYKVLIKFNCYSDGAL